MTRRLVVIALVCFAGLTALCAGASTASASSLRLTAAERAVIGLINQARVDHGLQPLKVRTSLCRAARSHSAEMVRRGFFSHLSWSGRSQAARVQRYGYSRSACSTWSAGEVIAYGGGLAGTPRAIVDAWLRSSPHRALLLDPRWRDVGVGRARGTFCGIGGTAVYTVDLGRRIH
jgi:uncharacterized protein YkwD